jgi:hypothetical protein
MEVISLSMEYMLAGVGRRFATCIGLRLVYKWGSRGLEFGSNTQIGIHLNVIIDTGHLHF